MPATTKNNIPHLDFVKVEEGTFTMGDIDKKITLLDYYMAIYQVTQALYERIMGDNPSYFKGKNKPVEQVSFVGADL